MPKYKKGRKSQVDIEAFKEEIAADRHHMFRSSWMAYIAAAIFLVSSIILNAGVWSPLGTTPSTLMKVVFYGIRGGLVALFYFFALIAWGNVTELRGGVMGIKAIIFLAVISLIQTFENGYVFLVGLLGVILISVYIWLIQAKIQ